MLNTRVHGSMLRQWVQQFCLDIVKSSDARVLFKPVDVATVNIRGVLSPLTLGPLIQLPRQHASINVTLASSNYSFDYNNPDSVCGIVHAARNAALLWGIIATLGGHTDLYLFVATA